MPIAILTVRPWLSELGKCVAETLRGRPAALVFGKKDPPRATTHGGPLAARVPDAGVVELFDAGHFLREAIPTPV